MTQLWRWAAWTWQHQHLTSFTWVCRGTSEDWDDECMEGVMSYEYLWISDHSVTIQWPFSDHLVTIQWPFSDHLVTIQWSQCSVVISETVRLKRFATRLLFDKLQRRRVQNDWLELMEYGKTMMTHHESLLFICEDKAMMNTQLIDGQY